MKIEFNNKEPIFWQLADAIKQSILAVDLIEGDTIPSVRKMAADYGINPQTILKATQTLMNEGILEKRRGRGMFVKNGALDILMRREFECFTKQEIPNLIKRAKMLDLDKNELFDIIEKEF